MAVGKSTVYHQCIQNRPSTSNWINSSEASRLLISSLLERKPPVKRILGTIASYFNCLTPMILEQLAIKTLGEKALTDSAHNWDKLLAHYFMPQRTSNNSDDLLTLRRNRYLLDFLELLALYNKHLNKQTIFLDEGICKRAGGVLIDCAANSSEGLSDIPLPEALICLNASPSTIHARLLARQRVRTKNGSALAIRHMSDSKTLEYVTDAVQRTDRVCRFMEAEGLKVLKINAENPLAEQVHEVMTFIESI